MNKETTEILNSLDEEEFDDGIDLNESDNSDDLDTDNQETSYFSYTENIHSNDKYLTLSNREVYLQQIITINNTDRKIYIYFCPATQRAFSLDFELESIDENHPSD